MLIYFLVSIAVSTRFERWHDASTELNTKILRLGEEKEGKY